MLLGPEAELPAQPAGNLLDLAGERCRQGLNDGGDLRRALLNQLDRFAPRGLLLLGSFAAPAFPTLQGLAGAAQDRPLVVEHLPDRADERILVAAHLPRPRLAGLVEGLPEVGGHGAQVRRRGVQQVGGRRDLRGGGGQALDAPLQAGRRLQRRPRLRGGRFAHVLDAPVELRERIGEAAHGLAERLAQLVADRVGEPLLGRVLLAARP